MHYIGFYRILTPADYAAFVAEEQKPVPFVPPEVEPIPVKAATPSVSQPNMAASPAEVKLAPVLDEDDVTDMFIKVSVRFFLGGIMIYHVFSLACH